MNRFPSSNRDTTTTAPLGDGGTVPDRPLAGRRSGFQERVSRIMVVLAFIALCMIGTGLMLRFAVSQLNDPKGQVVEMELRQASHPIESTLKARSLAAEELRSQARAFDERLLSRRRDRQWVYETEDLPDSDHARGAWQQQVDEIKAHITEAQQLQAMIEANEDGQKPSLFEEGSVLQGRLKQLERLREDAPPGW